MIDQKFYSIRTSGFKENNICLFESCNLKSIKNFDFCYQHVDMFVKKNSNKYTICKWRDDENSKKCNQLALKNSTNKNKNKDEVYSPNEFCFTHLAFENLRKKRMQSGDECNQLLVKWDNEFKGFNEIRSCLTRKERELSESDDDEKNDKKFFFANLVDIDDDPQILKSSNDSSDKLMMEIIDKYANSESDVQIEKNIRVPVERSINEKVVYTKDELVKIYKLKLSKLKFMYRKQLNILNDKLIIDRKRYLLMKKNENTQAINELDTSSVGLYKSLNHTENYLKRRFDPRFVAKNGSNIYKSNVESNNSKCSFSYSNGNNYICSRKCLPQSKFCKHHIRFDQNQTGFCNCSLTPKTDVYGPNIVLIKQISHKCCDDLIGNRYVKKEFEEKLNENLVPHHLVNIYNKFLELLEEKKKSSESNNDGNSYMNDEINYIEDNLRSDLSSKIENQIDSEASNDSSSTNSSSSDSSLSSTSSDSKKSLISSSSISSTDSDSDSDVNDDDDDDDDESNMEEKRREETQN